MVRDGKTRLCATRVIGVKYFMLTLVIGTIVIIFRMLLNTAMFTLCFVLRLLL